jgi:hypothetical protein
MDDAAAAVRGFEAERQAAVRVAVEDDAQPLEVGDGSGCRSGDAPDNRGIAEPVAGRQRIGGVQRRLIVGPDCRGDAACAQAGRALGQRRSSRITFCGASRSAVIRPRGRRR